MRRVGEVKYTDASSLLQNVSATGSIQAVLGNLVRGDNGINGFDGNTISPIGVTIKFAMHTDQVYNFCRFMVFQWLDSSTPAVSGILQSQSTGLAPFSSVLVTNRKEIRVLSDTQIALTPGATGVNGVFQKNIFIPGRKLAKIRYNSTTNVVQHGGIFILTISDDVLTAYPQCTWYARVSFTD